MKHRYVLGCGDCGFHESTRRRSLAQHLGERIYTNGCRQVTIFDRFAHIGAPEHWEYVGDHLWRVAIRLG
jgi:hypothetical protein